MNIENTRNRLLRESRISLKKKCKSLKISSEGSKSDMIERIMINKYGNNQLFNNTEQQNMELRAKRQQYLRQRRNGNISHQKGYILNKFNCRLLVTGYIRRLDKLINITIPNDIVTLCIACYFNNHFQVLPPYRVQSELCCVDEEDKIFTTPGTDSGKATFAIFKTPWKEGIHELKFECIHNVGCAVSIGMVTNVNADCKEWLFDRSESQLSYQLYSCRLQSDNGIYCYQNGTEKSFERMEGKVSDGMVISMIVDFNKWTIIYYLNETQAGNSMKIVQNQIYYPSIAYKTWNGHWDKEKNKTLKYRLLLCL